MPHVINAGIGHAVRDPRPVSDDAYASRQEASWMGDPHMRRLLRAEVQAVESSRPTPRSGSVRDVLSRGRSLPLVNRAVRRAEEYTGLPMGRDPVVPQGPVPVGEMMAHRVPGGAVKDAERFARMARMMDAGGF